MSNHNVRFYREIRKIFSIFWLDKKCLILSYTSTTFKVSVLVCRALRDIFFLNTSSLRVYIYYYSNQQLFCLTKLQNA